MSEYIVTKSLSEDFSSNLVNHQLQEAINDGTSISRTANRVDTAGDVVEIVFDGTLTSSELTYLDTIISGHSSYIYPEPDEQVVLIPKRESVKNKNYTRVMSFEYRGDLTKKIVAISVSSWINSNPNSNSSYGIKVQDVTDGLTIAEQTFTNTVETSNNLTLSNIPTGTSIIEFYVSSPDKKDVYIESITLYLK